MEIAGQDSMELNMVRPARAATRDRFDNALHGKKSQDHPPKNATAAAHLIIKHAYRSLVTRGVKKGVRSTAATKRPHATSRSDVTRCACCGLKP